MQSIIHCSIPLHESIYLLLLQQISLHIYHMVYGPKGQRQVSWAYNLHYVRDSITHPCPRYLLLAILRVLDKQFTQTSDSIKSVTSLLIASFHDNGGLREYQTHQNLLKVMPFHVEIACHRGKSPSGPRRVITLTAPGARKP